jgi:hypothetical protein
MGTRDEIAAALVDIDTEIAATQERLEALRLERRGAEALLRRLRLPTDAAPSPAGSATRASGTGNTAIVANILSEYPDGLHLSEIEAKTAERDTPLDNEQVRGAVTYLKRVNRAERRGRGVWRLLAHTDEESPGPSGLSVVPTSSQEGVATG